MRIVLFGYSSVGARAFRVLRDIGEDVAAVYTHEDDPRERRWFDSLSELAARARVPVRFIPAANVKGALGCEPEVSSLEPDLVLSAYCRVLLPGSILEIPKLGALNLHGSLLPRYRGRAPVNWVLVHGEAETGMTLHYMTPRADAGDIVGQERLSIGPDETAPELQARLEDAAESLLRRWIPEIARGTAPRIPQDLSKGSYFGRRRPEDGRFEWTWPARRIHDLVRAVTRPFPGAFVVDGSRRLVVWRTRVAEGWMGPPLVPGELRRAPGAEHPVAGTGDGVLELLEHEVVQG